MTPEELRRLYRQDRPATEQEATEALQDVRSDPALARQYIESVYSLSTEDPSFAFMLRVFLEGMVMRMVLERAQADDDFALNCGTLLADLTMKTRPQRVERGKPRPASARSA